MSLIVTWIFNSFTISPFLYYHFLILTQLIFWWNLPNPILTDLCSSKKMELLSLSPKILTRLNIFVLKFIKIIKKDGLFGLNEIVFLLFKMTYLLTNNFVLQLLILFTFLLWKLNPRNIKTHKYMKFVS